MIKMEDRNSIYAAFRCGTSNSAIARQFGISRKTVIKLKKEYDQAKQAGIKVLEDLMASKPTYKKRKSPKRKLSAEMTAIIDNALQVNAERRALGQRKQQKKGRDIFRDLRSKGYDISYKTVANYIKTFKKGDKTISVKDCFIKQNYVPGEQIEFDWGEVHIRIKGKMCRFFMGVMSTCSNGHRAKLFTRQDTLAMIEMHVYGLRHFGAVPSVMVYDNMRVAVKSFTGGTKTPTDALVRLCAFYGFTYRFCNVRSGNEKPHVERGVETVRRRAFAYEDEFLSLTEANKYLESVCDQLCEDVHERLQEELSIMRPLEEDMSCFVAEYRKVDKLSTFCYGTNHYSVPYIYIGGEVWVKAFSDKIEVYNTDGTDNRLIAEHERSYETDAWVMDLNHYLEVLVLKPGAVKNSVALSQTPEALQSLYNRHFGSLKSKSFMELLLWARDNGHTYQDIISAVRLSEIKGVRDITADIIKSAITSSVDSITQKSNYASIEESSGCNLIQYGVLFNLSKQA